MQSAGSWQPGLIALHGNKTEALADTVLAWLAANPLQALEPEIVLVQSSGMAEVVQDAHGRASGRVRGGPGGLPARCLAQLPADSRQA
ncbi:exodeoxyribonuclease V subunit gamma [Staphylococcus epidermidis]|nr:exodeoxyribonuclease V subunit gamma [Staphylococcus epidermidis]